jgi:hypothetical protein
MRKEWRLLFIFLILLLSVQHVDGQDRLYRKMHFGLYAGLGLPRVPFSIYLPPISLAGGGMANIRIAKRFILQVDGFGLHTINLGTVTDQKKDLRFNLYGGSFNILYPVKRGFSSETFVSIGMDRCHISQLFDDKEENLTSTGLNLGLVLWKHYRRWSSLLEIRWHLFFHPSPNPQVLLITFGILL